MFDKVTEIEGTNPEQVIDVFETDTRCFGDCEPCPDATDDGDGCEEPEGAGGGETAFGGLEEHEGHRAGVAVLVDEVEAHDQGTGDGSDTERVNLSVQQVLHRVPAHGPAETTDVTVEGSV